jgi:hypothetical protein
MDKRMRNDLCRCGSGLWSEAQYDGRGIYLCRTCPQCHKREMSKYNPVILKYYTQADIDEPIEEDY